MKTDETLVKEARGGNAEAEETLIERYKAEARKKAQAYFIAGSDTEDVIQEAMIGLFKAIRTFDDAGGAAFRTYANACMTNQILNAIRSANSAKNAPLNSSTSTDEDGKLIELMATLDIDAQPEKALIWEELLAEIKAKESTVFSKLERNVLEAKLKGLDYVDIAKKLGKTPKSIDNAIQRIRKKVISMLM